MRGVWKLFRWDCHPLLGGLVVTVLLLGADSAFAAQRYAEPGGNGPAATCPQTDPCDLDTAVEDVSVVDGDEIILTSGTYSIAQLIVSDAVTIHGESGQPRPRVNTTIMFGFYVTDAATLRDLDTTTTSGAAIYNGAAGVTIERVHATSTSSGAIVCWIGNSATVRDSICASTATNSNGIGANSGIAAGNYTITLRNVTAVGTNGGMKFDYGNPGVNVVVDAKSVIASGISYDVSSNGSLGATIQVNLEYSNYNQKLQVGGATVTDPGTGAGNQTALPQFANAAAGDYHQLATSPTIDAGVIDGSSGTADLDGDARALDGDGVCPLLAVADIGADEYAPGIPDCAAPETSITGGPAGVTNDNMPTFDLNADDPGATFECKVDGGGFSTCATPFTTAMLADGPHTVQARATDLNDNTDPTPASRSFTVDTRAPETTIGSAPKAKLKTKKKRVKVKFKFGADEGASFECALDGAGFAPCSSPLTAKVGKGKHTFTVRAIDSAGNVEGSPATCKFKVKRKRR